MKIAVMGDLHFPSAQGVSRPLESEVLVARDAFFDHFLTKFFAIESDLYVSVGDLTNCGLQDEFVEVFSLIDSHQKEFKLALGNHDLYTHTRQDVLKVIDETVNVAFEKEGIVFAFLETAREQRPDRWDGTLSLEQLAWLEQVVIESGDKTLVVIAHHPPYNTTAKSNHHYSSIEPAIDLWSILEQKQGKGIYVCGHVHTDSIVHHQQWTFVQIAAVLDSETVRVMDIQGDTLSIQSVDVSTEASRVQAQLLGENLEYFGLSPLGVGTPLLQATTVRW